MSRLGKILILLIVLALGTVGVYAVVRNGQKKDGGLKQVEVTQGTSLEQWLDAVSIYVEAPGLTRVLVAQKSGIHALPAGTTLVELDTSGVDLKPYVLAQTTTVTAEGTGTVPPVDTTIRATATVRVDVNVTGLLQ